MLRGRLGLNSGEGLAEDALRHAFEVARPTLTARGERLFDDLPGPRAVAGRVISLGQPDSDRSLHVPYARLLEPHRRLPQLYPPGADLSCPEQRMTPDR